MTNIADRRHRIAKIRSVERRVAEYQLARADRAIEHIRQIQSRISTLRSGTHIELGQHDGGTLAANAEMAVRLDNAKHITTAPLVEAAERREGQMLVAIHARQREDGAKKLAETAGRNAQAAADQKANTNRIHRPSGHQEGTST